MTPEVRKSESTRDSHSALKRSRPLLQYSDIDFPDLLAFVSNPHTSVGSPNLRSIFFLLRLPAFSTSELHITLATIPHSSQFFFACWSLLIILWSYFNNFPFFEPYCRRLRFQPATWFALQILHFCICPWIFFVLLILRCTQILLATPL